MNRYLKVDKRTVIIEADGVRYFRIIIPDTDEYHDIYGHLCSNCYIAKSRLSNLYCNELVLDDNSKILCKSLYKIGYKTSYIQYVGCITTMSLYRKSLLTKLIKNHEERRFIKIETGEQV